jgi:hypothetical protein
MTAPAALHFWIGATWQFSVAFKNPDGSARNLTGSTVAAEFVPALQVQQIPLTVGNGGITVPDPTTGVAFVKIISDYTKDVTAQTLDATKFPTRVVMEVTDALGALTREPTVLILPRDPRTDPNPDLP